MKFWFRISCAKGMRGIPTLKYRFGSLGAVCLNQTCSWLGKISQPDWIERAVLCIQKNVISKTNVHTKNVISKTNTNVAKKRMEIAVLKCDNKRWSAIDERMERSKTNEWNVPKPTNGAFQIKTRWLTRRIQFWTLPDQQSRSQNWIGEIPQSEIKLTAQNWAVEIPTPS